LKMDMDEMEAMDGMDMDQEQMDQMEMDQMGMDYGMEMGDEDGY